MSAKITSLHSNVFVHPTVLYKHGALSHLQIETNCLVIAEAGHGMMLVPSPFTEQSDMTKLFHNTAASIDSGLAKLIKRRRKRTGLYAV